MTFQTEFNTEQYAWLQVSEAQPAETRESQVRIPLVHCVVMSRLVTEWFHPKKKNEHKIIT